MIEVKPYYIVLDLEWIAHPEGQSEQYRSFPFEIIEIGAVRLNCKREIVDQFSEYVRPQVFSLGEAHRKVKEMLQVDEEELARADTFPEVCNRFLRWCGHGYRFCTWGSMDLTELQRNMAWYHMNAKLGKPILYYDLQKVYAILAGEGHPKALEAAVEEQEIEKTEPFHGALSDARYTAKVLMSMDLDAVIANYSVDYYNHPKTKAEELYLDYAHYSQFISREFETKEELLRSRGVNVMPCPFCRGRTIKQIRWFTNNMKNYYCLSYCRKHGYLSGKIHLKRTEEGKLFAIKTITGISETEAKKLRTRYETAKKKNLSPKPEE